MMMDNSTPNAPAYFTYPGKLEGYKKGRPLLTALLGVVLYVVFVVVLVILTNRMSLSFMTTDTTVMRKLKG